MRPRGTLDGFDRAFALPATVRIHRLVSYYLSLLHDRARSVADCARSAASVDRASGLPSGFRVLAEDLRRGIRARCRLRDRHGVPVRYELERAGSNVRTHPGSAALLRDLHRFFSRGELFRHPTVWPPACAAVVLSVFDGDGGPRHDILGILDHGQ